MNKFNAADEIGFNRDGWFCLRHRDGWLVGTEQGVTCYRQEYLAKAALTFACEREKGRRMYRIVVFNRTKDLVNTGEHTPMLSASEAWKSIEPKKKHK